MRKRPLCFVVVWLIFIQILLTKGHLIGYDKAFSFLAEDESYVAEVTGTVYKKEQKPKCQILYLKNSRIVLNNKSIENSKIQVRIGTKDHISIGNKIKVKGKATGFQSARNPGNFNLKKYYAARGIYVQVQADTMSVLNQKVNPLKEGLSILREKWKSLLLKQMGAHYGSIVSAMLTGDKSELEVEISELYKQVGISHILAISGLHMSFIGFGMYRILRGTGMSFAGAGIESFILLMAYTVLSGCGVSSIRALIMFLIRMGAEITGRDYDMPTSMAVTAFGMCLWRPLYLLDEGFILSNTALIAIAVVVPCMQECFNPEHKLTKAFVSGFGIQMTLLPVLLYFYFELPLYSILVNILIIPGMSVILGAGIFGSLLGIFWEGGASIVFCVCKWILQCYELLCKLVLQLPKSIVITGKPLFVGVCIYYGILFLICYMIVVASKCKAKFKKGKIARLTIITLAGVLGISCVLPRMGKKQLIITMLDVGQGDGIYIKTPGGQNLFVDGGSTNITQVGEQRIGTFLKCKGVTKLDYVMISHSDSDHKNGIEELLQDQKHGIQISTLLLPEQKVWDKGFEELAKLAKTNGTKVKIFKEGQKMGDEKFCIECLAPGRNYGGASGNEASMVLELRYKKFRMIFTGDLEGEGERQLEQSGKLKKCTVLKVAHHGSKNSTSEKFMEETRPYIALISSGINNRYGHPDKETLERLEKYGCSIYRTQKKGAITLKTNGEKIKIYENLK